MKKEDILKMSQKENEGKLDERELEAFGKASRVGMAVGGIICVILVIVSRFVLDIPELALAAWMVYFSMQGSSDITLYKYLKTKSKLVCGVLWIIFAVAFAVALAVKTVI